MLRKYFYLLSVFLFASGSFSFGQTAKPKSSDKKPRTVVDFLMLLPKNYVGNYTVSMRQKHLKNNGTTDTANGFLQFFGNGEADAFVTVAIFKKDDGNYLITTSAASTNVQKYYFLDYDGKKFVDAANRVLPSEFGIKKFHEGFTCELPRFNRTINCRDADGKLTYLGWTGKEFVIE